MCAPSLSLWLCVGLGAGSLSSLSSLSSPGTQMFVLGLALGGLTVALLARAHGRQRTGPACYARATQVAGNNLLREKSEILIILH
jgi:hypothetical protein